MAVLDTFVKNPKYVFVRGVGRFGPVRRIVTETKRLLGSKKAQKYRQSLMSEMGNTIFANVHLDDFMRTLNEDGCAFGLKLPRGIVEEIQGFAESHPIYAFRDPKLGFWLPDLETAETKLGKEILLAQYFNVQDNCSAVSKLVFDPLLNCIALNYLGCIPRFFGVNLWWTFPVTPNRQDQLRHAQFFHRDIDDFRFLKFFFYITDVQKGDGTHWIVRGSHKRAPFIRFRDHFTTRRFEDREIREYYDESDLIEVVGSRGEGFAEDTLCVHKASCPSAQARLVLQLQFGLFNFAPEGDKLAHSELQNIPLPTVMH